MRSPSFSRHPEPHEPPPVRYDVIRVPGLDAEVARLLARIQRGGVDGSPTGLAAFTQHPDERVPIALVEALVDRSSPLHRRQGDPIAPVPRNSELIDVFWLRLELFSRVARERHQTGVHWTPLADVLCWAGLWPVPEWADLYQPSSPELAIECEAVFLRPIERWAMWQRHGAALVPLFQFRSPVLWATALRYTPAVDEDLLAAAFRFPEAIAALAENPNLPDPYRDRLAQWAIREIGQGRQRIQSGDARRDGRASAALAGSILTTLFEARKLPAERTIPVLVATYVARDPWKAPNPPTPAGGADRPEGTSHGTRSATPGCSVPNTPAPAVSGSPGSSAIVSEAPMPGAPVVGAAGPPPGHTGPAGEGSGPGGIDPKRAVRRVRRCIEARTRLAKLLLREWTPTTPTDIQAVVDATPTLTHAMGYDLVVNQKTPLPVLRRLLQEFPRSASIRGHLAVRAAVRADAAMRAVLLRSTTARVLNPFLGELHPSEVGPVLRRLVVHWPERAAECLAEIWPPALLSALTPDDLAPALAADRDDLRLAAIRALAFATPSTAGKVNDGRSPAEVPRLRPASYR